jgi:hypothetical protein
MSKEGFARYPRFSPHIEATRADKGGEVFTRPIVGESMLDDIGREDTITLEAKFADERSAAH